jgi:hypothetical protein
LVECLVESREVACSNHAGTTKLNLMNKEEKVKRKVERAKIRYQKNLDRNISKLKKKKAFGKGNDCPFDVEMNGTHGTCHCGGADYNDCLGDI